MTSPHFKKAMIFVLKWEGGYSNHPSDNGGATNKGITQTVYDEYRLANNLCKRSIRLIENSEVETIYYRYYWLKCYCDYMTNGLDTVVFDTSVNMGVSRAVKFLQRCLEIEADGVIGDKTIKALNSINHELIIASYIGFRENFYKQIVKNKPSQNVFLRGWLNRIAELYEYVTK